MIDLLRKGCQISVVTRRDQEGREILARVTQFDPEQLEYVVESMTSEQEQILERRMRPPKGGNTSKA